MKRLFAMLLALVLVLSMTACGGGETFGEDGNTGWPEKAIQITVCYSAGGDSDLYARKCAEYLEDKLGVNVVVMNVTGAGDMAGSIEVAASSPDGYSVLFNHYGKLVQEVCEGTADFSFVDDFTAGCTVLVDNSYTLCAAKSTGITDYASFVEYATAHPGELSIVAGANSNGYDIVSKIENAVGVSLGKVEGPSSVSERVAAVLGGQHELIYGNYKALSDYIENGDLTVIGSIGEEPCASYDDLPCLSVLSGNPVVSPYIFSFSFPAGTDQAVVDAFDSAMKEICEDENFVSEITAMGGNIFYNTGAESDAMQREMLPQIRERLGL